jgi:hypothetical protein
MSWSDFEESGWAEERSWDRERRAEELLRRVQRLCVLIVSTDYPLVDIQIERANLRQEAQELFPDKIDVYDRIYESRFDRLIEQFRQEDL